MNAFNISSDPRIIGGYYMEADWRGAGSSRITRCNRGTETFSGFSIATFTMAPVLRVTLMELPQMGIGGILHLSIYRDEGTSLVFSQG